MTTVQLFNLGVGGISKDLPPHLLAPELWSDGNNMRMFDEYPKRALGHTQVLGTPSVAPGFIFNVPAQDQSFWLYANLSAVFAYNVGVHTDITRAAGPYTAANLRDWNGCLLGGVPILNNGSDVPQYWPTLNVATDLANLANWPTTLRAKVIRNFGKYLVALNVTEGANALTHTLRWSHAAEPGTIPTSWDNADPAVDAGRTHLTDTQGGDLLDGLLLGSQLILYKERSTHAMRFIGGNDIFGFDLLTNAGVFATRCAAIIDNGMKHLVVGEDDVIMHQGTRGSVEYPIDVKNRRFLYSDIDSTNFVNAFMFDNPAQKEAWFCYPSSGSEFPNKAMIYNYRTGSCWFRDFEGLGVDLGNFTDQLGPTWDSVTGSWDSQTNPWGGQGRKRILVADNVASKIWGLENGLAFGTRTTTSYLERIGIAFDGKDRQGKPKANYQTRKLFGRVWSKIRGTAPVEVRVGAQETIGSTINWAPYQAFNLDIGYNDFEVNGVLGAIGYRSVADLDWQLEGYDLEYNVVGSHH